MEYNSFYGGRRGASFVIVKRYDTIQQMTTDFALGADFTDVNFDEYVIIDNKNRNDPDNGKLFRRGYDFDSSRQIVYTKAGNDVANESENRLILAHGAEYVGTIIGSPGKAPHLQMTSIAQIRWTRYLNNAKVTFIKGQQLKLQNYYKECYNINSGILIQKYQDQINHLNADIQRIENQMEGMSATDKDAIIKQLEKAVEYYQELITQMRSALPELENKIELLLDELRTYVNIVQDKTGVTNNHPYDFWNEIDNKWEWNLVTNPSQPFKCYKINKVENPDFPGQIEYYTYDITDPDSITISDDDLSYSDDAYTTKEYIDLVPGKVDDNTYNDVIEYACVTIPDDTNNTGATAFIGFKFPYLVNEFSTKTVDQYDNNGNYSTEKSKIERDDNYQHPFYQHWTISIPKGIHGQDIIRLTVESESEENNNKNLYYYYKNYDNKRMGVQSSRQLIASYDIIDKISVDSTGTVTISYTGTKNDDTFYLDLINKIEIGTLNTETGVDNRGKLIFTHTHVGNPNDPNYGQSYTTEIPFDYVTGVTIDQDVLGHEDPGTIIVWHSDPSKHYTYDKKLKFIKRLDQINNYTYDLVYNILDENNQPVKDTFHFNYVDGFRFNKEQGQEAVVQYHTVFDNQWHTLTSTDVQDLEFFKGFDFNEETGQLSAIWDKSQSGGSSEDYQQLGQIIFPITLQILQNGKVKITYSDGSTSGGGQQDQAVIVYPKTFSYTDTTGKINVTDNTGASSNLNGTIEYPKTFSYTDNNGTFSATTNIGNSATINGTIRHVKDISYTDNTGVFTATYNTGTPVSSQIGSIEYIKAIGERQKSNLPITRKDNFYEFYKDTNKGNRSAIPNSDISKNANEIRLTSDFHIVAKYNNIPIYNGQPWDLYYKNAFGNNWKYSGSDEHYNVEEPEGVHEENWVDLGYPGLKPHSYDIAVVTANDKQTKGFPNPLKTGGFMFIVEGDEATVPYDYYDEGEVNNIEQSTPEVWAVSSSEYENGTYVLPAGWKDGLVMFIYDDDDEDLLLHAAGEEEQGD